MKLTLEKYKIIDAITSDKSLSEIDKTLYCICTLFNYSPDALDKEDPLKVVKMAAKVEKAFKFKITTPVYLGIYKISYNISNITFGQYIELSYFFQGNPVENGNFIIATCAKGLHKSTHITRAKYFLKKNISSVAGAVSKIREGYTALNKEFGALFGLDDEVHPEANSNSFMTQFNNRYGWIYSAHAVAVSMGISVNQAYNLPIKEALNELVYLKNKQKYEYLLTKT